MNATEKFLAYVQNAGFSSDDAKKVLTVFKKKKALKFGLYDSDFHVSHGALLEPEVFERAIEMYNKGDAKC